MLSLIMVAAAQAASCSWDLSDTLPEVQRVSVRQEHWSVSSVVFVPDPWSPGGGTTRWELTAELPDVWWRGAPPDRFVTLQVEWSDEPTVYDADVVDGWLAYGPRGGEFAGAGATHINGNGDGLSFDATDIGFHSSVPGEVDGLWFDHLLDLSHGIEEGYHWDCDEYRALVATTAQDVGIAGPQDIALERMVMTIVATGDRRAEPSPIGFHLGGPWLAPVGALTPGGPAAVEVTGAEPRAAVGLVVGRELGAGPCLRVLDDACLRITDPVFLGAVRAAPDGSADLSGLTLPLDWAVGEEVVLQVVSRDADGVVRLSHAKRQTVD